MNEPLKLHGAPVPKPDSTEEIPPLNHIDLAFHQNVLRLATGIIAQYREWIKIRSK